MAMVEDWLKDCFWSDHVLLKGMVASASSISLIFKD